MYKMEPLDKSIRNKLKHVVVEARDITEAAARAALEQLGVGEAMPFAHLTEEERRLRRKLRVHGRQLGNIRNSRGEQEIGRLVEEVAYEHWHRMLFARFLAENNLLMYPDPEDPVAVTLEECEDLASQEGVNNGWELAAHFATRMLPQIFRPDSPVFQLVLPPEYQQKLERLVANLPQVVFTASDSLGWVYQFWQTKKKAEVNASEVKIGARELPAVTQLFTEPYMVSFLLDNSLGAWWAALRLTKSNLKNASSEEELRKMVALPNVPFEYLRFVKINDSYWAPAAGTFDSWPESLSEFKSLDPCCGSGHFLVAIFLMLVPMRMELEKLSAREAVDTVLCENIHGLELNRRCVELAAFNLALTAWRYPNAGGYRPLPELNVACSGLAISAKKEKWLSLAGDNTNLHRALEELYLQFKDAPVLGSLINPELGLAKSTLYELRWDEVDPLLTKALSVEKNDEKSEMNVVARGIAKSASLLADHYHLITTNVPYLALRKQSLTLSELAKTKFPDSKQNLAVVFIERCFSLLTDSGIGSYVCPQDWIFLDIYKDFRRSIIQNKSINSLAKLGTKSFTTPMWDMNIMLISIGNNTPENEHNFIGLDLSNLISPKIKAAAAKEIDILLVSQLSQILNPDCRIVFGELSDAKYLGGYADALMGVSTGDGVRFHKEYWELRVDTKDWEFIQSTVSKHLDYGGRSQVIFWQEERGEIYKLAESVKHLNHSAQNWQRGRASWGKRGVVISQMGDLPATLYTGEIYDCNCCAIVPFSEDDLLPLWAYTQSDEFRTNVRQINQALKVPPKTLLKVGFDRDSWNNEAVQKYPEGLPKPCSDDPTQWIFHGHPVSSDEPLQVAVARLLGFCWPAEQDSAMELSNEARAWVKKTDALLSFADEDGIVCIPPVRGEASGANRLLNLLAAAYDNTWSNNKLAQLLRQFDNAGKTLDTWLRDKFFSQHCTLFHHRPFIWHVWDGLRDGFGALVNYHKLDAKLLESLIYVYLGDWISRQKQDKANGVDGSEEKFVAAEQLKKRLELILEGEAPYDIFVRWKPIEKQPIGWDPDLNDGVRLNIHPFLSVPDVGRKGAGVLRDKPNINWNKDRGKDVKSAPWYYLGLQYGAREGDRINDHHLSLAEKRAARQANKMETR